MIKKIQYKGSFAIPSMSWATGEALLWRSRNSRSREAAAIQGHILVPKLLKRGDEVVVVDTQWFGNFLEEHPKSTTLKRDIDTATIIPLEGVD